jgi:hypothetical protein
MHAHSTIAGLSDLKSGSAIHASQRRAGDFEMYSDRLRVQIFVLTQSLRSIITTGALARNLASKFINIQNVNPMHPFLPIRYRELDV